MSKETQFKSGAEWTGNAKGRPKGSGGALKHYDRKKFYNMTDEEKEEFLSTIPPELRYRQAEGNPHQTEEKTIDANITIVAPSGVVKKLEDDKSN